LQSEDELVLCTGDFNGHVGRWCDGYEEVHGGNGYGERNSVMKRRYVWQIRGLGKERKGK